MDLYDVKHKKDKDNWEEFLSEFPDLPFFDSSFFDSINVRHYSDMMEISNACYPNEESKSKLLYEYRKVLYIVNLVEKGLIGRDSYLDSNKDCDENESEYESDIWFDDDSEENEGEYESNFYFDEDDRLFRYEVYSRRFNIEQFKKRIKQINVTRSNFDKLFK